MNTVTYAKVKIRPIILCGGSGERLWPLSRPEYPKQFSPLLGDEPLFIETLRRVSDRAQYEAPLIVGSIEHRFLILSLLERENIHDAIILLEPLSRNTAAAAVIAALHEQDDDALHLLMPCDHVIADEKAFHLAIEQAAIEASAGKIMLFGITPHYPEVGYGYIIPAKENSDSPIQTIQRFHEKPLEAVAEKLIREGALWNSGIFLYAPESVTEEVSRLAPKYYEACSTVWHTAKTEGKCTVLDSELYGAIDSVSFDRLIMEHTQLGAVLPCSMGWSDVGSWKTLWRLAQKDGDNNVKSGSVVTQDVKSSYIRSEGPKVVAIGMEECIVVANKEAVMIAPFSRAQEVKGLLSAVEHSPSQTQQAYNSVPRPWGSYETIADGQRFRVKHVIVRPGQALSLQIHRHRAEHWVVVAGVATTECNGVHKQVQPNESVFIPQGAAHRLSNEGETDLELIEVQSGDYIGEDDIIRLEDKYGRRVEAAENATGKMAKSQAE